MFAMRNQVIPLWITDKALSHKIMNAQNNIFDRICASQFTRILIVCFLILLLQIPIVFLLSLVSDRQQLHRVAVSDITSKWGEQQTLIGPQLVVPYRKWSGSGKTLRSDMKHATFLPETLQLSGHLESETRYRGLFKVPVYRANLEISGEFQRPDFSTWGIKAEDILWDDTELALQISDTSAIQNQALLSWNSSKIPLAPGKGKFGSNRPGVHVGLRGKMQGNAFKFVLPLELNGSERINLAPFGKVTNTKLTSNWSDPSFQGPWLPENRQITAEGFEASWNIPSLGRSYAQQWNNEQPVAENLIADSLFGVDLIAPVDNYRMVNRSIKYNFLFLVLTFAVFWLFEVIVRLRVHPLQYLMIGTAMCMFYLLQLSLSEHIGFQIAYLVASGAVVVLTTTYSIAVLKASQRGGTIGITQAMLYGYLYIVLAHQSYALLIGSIGLFLFLAVVMYLTRRIDWFNLNQTTDSERA